MLSLQHIVQVRLRNIDDAREPSFRDLSSANAPLEMSYQSKLQLPEVHSHVEVFLPQIEEY